MKKIEFQVNTGFDKGSYKISAAGYDKGKHLIVFASNFPTLLRRIKKVHGLKLEQILLSFQPE